MTLMNSQLLNVPIVSFRRIFSETTFSDFLHRVKYQCDLDLFTYANDGTKHSRYDWGEGEDYCEETKF